VFRPKVSCRTSTWASVWLPAPIPIVGTTSWSVTAAEDLSRHHLQEHGERAGALHRVRVSQDALGGASPTLEAVTTQGVLVLGCEADVGVHRIPPWVSFSICGAMSAALELDHGHLGLLQEPGRGREGLFRSGLVAAEREVSDDEGTGHAVGCDAHQWQQFVDCHGE
jgi:hypothetical protein